MNLKDEVMQFIKDFIFKLEFWGLLVRMDRTNDKNNKTLLALEINYSQLKKILGTLKYEDYSEGPVPDNLYKVSDMWIFGKVIKGKEVYIKIQLGNPESHTICISFHFSEHPMNYPFKNQNV